MNRPDINLKPDSIATSYAEPLLQRAVGQVRVGFKRRGELTVLKDLFQQGSGKVRLPQLQESEVCEAVLINTSGGLTDHDRFAVDAHWDADTTAVVTTQAAERIYKSRHHAAYIDTSLTLQDNALGFWLPQETILFDRGRFKRQCNVTMAKGSKLLACESMVFGRAAMGEQVHTGFLAENWAVRYDGRLVFADNSRLEGDILETLKEPSVANGMQAWGTVLYVAENAEEFVETVRKIGQHENVLMACSVRGPVLVIRILGKSGAEMRAMLTDVLETLYSSLMNKSKSQTVTHGQDQILPRVWYC
ncbi:MAG: urease accessory protein UreD [Methyloligellaceae bacterium]